MNYTPSDITLEEALKMFRDAKRYVDTGFRDRWEKYFKVYRGERVDQGYIGTMSVVNREPHTIIETLVANIAGGLPKFHFVPTNEEQAQDTKVLNGVIDYYLNCNQMNLKNQTWVRDMLTYGVGILHVVWREGKAWIENIPLFDFFIDPTCTDLVTTTKPAAYAGFQYLARKTDLEATEVFDAKTNKWKLKYNLSDIGDVAVKDGSSSQMDKDFKDMFNGSTLENATLEQVHMILLYHLPSGKIVEIANQKSFAYKEDSHLQRKEETKEVEVLVDGNTIKSTKKLDEIKPFIPMAALRGYIDTSLFYAEGQMSVLLGDAELLNDYESMDADNSAYEATPMYQIDPQFADLAAEIETIPGAVYPIPKGALSPIEKQSRTDLTIKKAEVLDRMRRETAADEAVQGVSQAKSRTTATEIGEQLNQAKVRLNTMTTNLGYGGYAQLGSILFKMICIFLPKDKVIRIVGPDGIYWQNWDPWEYNGEYEPHVELDSDIKRKEIEVGMKDNQIFESLQNNPALDPVAVTRYILKRKDPNLTDEEFNNLVAKPAPPTPPDPREFVQLDKIYTAPGTSGFIKGQIEAMVGLQPDPMHAVTDQTALVHHAADQVNRIDQTTDAAGNTLPELLPQPKPTKPKSKTK